jgi:transcription-repair coupling factor (superfamily II helicase)
MSVMGLKDLSMIETPPKNRYPIQTYVMERNDRIITDAIERELSRGGQIFYLYNFTESIDLQAAKLKSLVPDARICVGHGKLTKDQLESVITKFINKEYDILLCTTIIETGIDMPDTNTLIIHDADRLGLSQLYQIKGRVGRSDRIAYAYFMYPEHKILNENAQKRLKTLQEFTELGSGYKIAQRDLMIRGAGDILGPEQAGFIDSIGLDMYIKLLNESVQDKLNGTVSKEEHSELNLNLSIEAYIPSTYASDADKIELYQEINSSTTLDQLNIVKHKVIDIYGKLPNEVELLFKKRQIDILTKVASVKSLTERQNQIEIILNDDYNKIRAVGNLLFESLIPFISFTKIAYRNKEFRITMNKRANWSSDVINLLEGLSNIVNKK